MTKEEQSPPKYPEQEHSAHGDNGHGNANMSGWLRNLIKGKPDSSLRDTLEEYIEEEEVDEKSASVSAHEKLLLSNILQLRDLKTSDVMVPRADIVAIEVGTSQKDLLALLAEKQFSRIPVYRENTDDILGTIHIKDVLSTLAKGEKITIASLILEAEIISPSMPVLDLLLRFRESKKHMALVVDEYGGIDGLITINDIIESIVGEIDDEHDQEVHPQITAKEDGSIIADARVDIEEFENKFGKLLSEEEREESHTLGGLVFMIAGRVPARGEVLTHDNGMVFEILDADPRRVNKICIRNIPTVLD